MCRIVAGTVKVENTDHKQVAHRGDVEVSVTLSVASANEADDVTVACHEAVVPHVQPHHVLLRHHAAAVLVDLGPCPPADIAAPIVG